MADTLRLAIVGCGAISRMHLNAAEEAGDLVHVTAAVDLDGARAAAVAAETGGRAFTSLDDALASDAFDAVALLLPPLAHEEATMRCLEAGKHVLVEKPMAPTVEACNRMLAVAAGTDRVFMVAENAQYWPEVVTARRLVDEGAIGEIVTARATAFTSLVVAGPWYEGDDPWRFHADATGGGVAVDIGSHWIRPLRMLMGEVVEVVAALDRPIEQMEGESLARALLRFESGRSASLEVLLIDSVLALEPFFRITGTKGEILVDTEMGGRTVLYNAERLGEPVGEPAGYMQSYGPQLVDFARACLEGKTPDAGPESSLGELRTALAMYRSVESGRWEKVWT